MEESKELQGFYKIFRAVIYVSILMEFFAYALEPEQSSNSFKTYYSSLKRCTLHQFWTFLVDNWNKIARLTRFLLLFLHRVRKRCAFEKESLFNNYK